jgi:hypothetical protein
MAEHHKTIDSTTSGTSNSTATEPRSSHSSLFDHIFHDDEAGRRREESPPRIPATLSWSSSSSSEGTTIGASPRGRTISLLPTIESALLTAASISSTALLEDDDEENEIPVITEAFHVPRKHHGYQKRGKE